MSDIYGIGVALKSSIDNYFRWARGSGRTSLLTKCIKQDDIVVFVTDNEAKYVKRIAKEKGINIKTIVLNPSRHFELSERMAELSGRLVFDHRWVELFYQIQLDRIGENLSDMVSSFSRANNG